MTDPTFGNNGLVVVQNYGSHLDVVIHDMVEQADGKILLTGMRILGDTTGFAYVQRQNADGSLDASFAQGGKYIGPESLGYGNCLRAVVRADGGILLCGTRTINGQQEVTLTLLTENGTVDTAFGGDGLVATGFSNTVSVGQMVLAPDQSVYVAGTFGAWPYIMHFLPDGTPDHAFGDDGIVHFDQAPWPAHGFDLALCPTGQLILAAGKQGWVVDAILLAACDLQGNLVPWFGNDGLVVIDSVENDLSAEILQRLTVRPNGSILGAGQWTRNGVTSTTVWAFLPDGSLDPAFGQNGLLEIPFPEDVAVHQPAIDVMPDGDIMLSGSQSSSNGLLCKTRLVRLNEDGSYHNAFGVNGVFLHYRPGAIFYYANKGGLLSNGKVAVVGSITTTGAVTKNGLIVFNPEPLAMAASAAPVAERLPLIFPNPARDRATVSGLELEPSSTLHLVDQQGRLRAQWTATSLPTESGGVQLDLPIGLAPGAYQLVVNSRSTRRSLPLVIER